MQSTNRKGSLTLGKTNLTLVTFISFLLSAVVTIDEEPCLLLPLHTREKVEKLLFRGGEADGQKEDSDWCNLAGLLGYEEERIAAFRQEEHPVCALLYDWAGKDSASINTLCTALRKINRDDVAQSLVLSPNPKPTATSVVWLQCKCEETTRAVAVIFYYGLQNSTYITQHLAVLYPAVTHSLLKAITQYLPTSFSFDEGIRHKYEKNQKKLNREQCRNLNQSHMKPTWRHVFHQLSILQILFYS